MDKLVMWPQRPAPYPVLAAALGPESVLTFPDPNYFILTL